jgi:hypothetical protein
VTAEHAAFAASVDPALYSVVAAEPTTEPEVRVLGVPGPVLEALRAAASSHVIPGARRWWVTGDRSMTAVHGAGTPHVAGPVAAATRVAAGAAVLSVRLAVAWAGFRPVTSLLPGGHARSVLAVVRTGMAAAPTRVERVLLTAGIARSAARPGAPAPVTATRGLLRTAADTEGVRLRTAVTAEERDRLLSLIPVDADAVPPGGIVALLGADHDPPAGDLRAGAALQRLLWTATALGWTGTVLAGPVELAATGACPRWRDALGVVPRLLVHVDTGTH